MRDYLLGKLDERLSAGFEERYFADRSFFLELQAAEYALIEEYLRGGLSWGDLRRFKRRYLKVPALRERLEEVRRRGGWAGPAGHRRAAPHWRFAMALVLVVVGLGVWVRWRSGRGALPVPATAIPAVELPVISLRLTPGLLKGQPSNQDQLALPGSRSTLRLSLDFPGARASFAATVQLYLAGEAGRSLVWSSPSVASVPAAGGQSVNVEIPTALLRRGDYIVEAGAAGDRPVSYVFHVVSSQ